MPLPTTLPVSPPPKTRPARILVAEDDLEMRRLVIDLLHHEGYEVVEATNGYQLLVRMTNDRAHPAAEPIDLILTDVRMPMCSGFDIVQGLRAAHCLTPVIFMTAFGDDEARARAERLNAILLDKPFELSALRDHVRELLRANGTADVGATATKKK